MQDKLQNLINNKKIKYKFFNTINSHKNYLIDTIKIYKDNYYAIYVENTIYEVILIKKN